MPPDLQRPHIWIHRGHTLRSRRLPFVPTIQRYSPASPRPALIAKRTLTSLEGDPDNTAMLESMVAEWLATADRLEAIMAEDTLPEKLARLMFSIDLPMKIKEQERAWDPSGDGTISRGEFRTHVRELGVDATSEQIDRLFFEWDTVRVCDCLRMCCLEAAGIA